jgi:hypothetical protein
VRLVTILVMALGLGAMTGFSAAAQTSTDITCQVVSPTGEINQSGTCTATVAQDGTCTLSVNGTPVPEGDVAIAQGACQAIAAGDCPAQVILTDGTIIQFTCGDEDTDTATETETETETDTATETETETETDTATETETETDTATETETGGQAEEEEDVEDLPETGQGPASDQGNSDSIVLLLGAMSVLTLGAAAALRQRQA